MGEEEHDTHAQALARIGGPSIKFGLPALDRPLRGVKRGYLFLIGGPPAGGKTLLTTHLVLNNLNLKIAWFTPDESHGWTIAKLAGLAHGKSTEEIEHMLADTRHRKALETWAETKLTNLFVSEEKRVRYVGEELARASAQWGGGPPDLWVWDYAGTLDPGYRSGMTEKIEWFKDMTKKLGCYGVIIHQAKKEEIGSDAIPTLDSLKEAGGPEAFQVLFVRRPPANTLHERTVQEMYPTSEVWILKNKAAPGLPADAVRFSIGAGGRLSAIELPHQPPTH